MDIKKFSFREAEKRECPIIKYDIAIQFLKYSKERNLSCKFLYFLDYVKKNYKDFKKTTIWDKRNVYCRKLISRMKLLD